MPETGATTSIATTTLPTGEAIPVLGQGTWTIADRPARRAEAIRALRAGLDCGMTLIDTAEMYGSGNSERLVAEAIAGRRDQVFLVTKVLPGNAVSRQRIVTACEGSLGRLKVSHIDLYLLHWRQGEDLAVVVDGLGRTRRDAQPAHDVGDGRQRPGDQVAEDPDLRVRGAGQVEQDQQGEQQPRLDEPQDQEVAHPAGRDGDRLDGQAGDLDLLIRAANADDDEFIFGLIERFVDFDLPKWRKRNVVMEGIRADLSRQIDEPSPGSFLFVAEDDSTGERVGFLHLQTVTDFFTGRQNCHVSDLAVARGHDGHGPALQHGGGNHCACGRVSTWM